MGNNFVNVFYPDEVNWTTKPVFQIDKETGELIGFFPSIYRASEHIKSTQNIAGNIITVRRRISNCMSGKEGRKSAYGFKCGN